MRGITLFQSFNGCDTVSAFYQHGKAKFWDTWLTSDYNNDISEDRLVLDVYNPKRTNDNLKDERVDQFLATADMILRSIPISLPGLLEHAKRASIQADWLWREGINNVDHQNPDDWGWTRDRDRFVPRWQLVDQALEISIICATCTCRSMKCT